MDSSLLKQLHDRAADPRRATDDPVRASGRAGQAERRRLLPMQKHVLVSDCRLRCVLFTRPLETVDLAPPTAFWALLMAPRTKMASTSVCTCDAESQTQ